MNFFGIAGLAIAITTGVMAFIMFKKGSKVSNLWGLFILSVMIWGAGSFVIATFPNFFPLWTWRVTYIGVILIPVFLYHFTYEFLNLRRKSRYFYLLIIIYTVGSMFMYTDLVTNLFIGNLEYKFEEFYYITIPSPLYSFFVFFFLIIAVYAIALLLIEYNRRKGIERENIKNVITGLVVGYIGGSLSFFPVYGVDIYPYFNISIAAGSLIISYTIVKYRLFDIRIFLRRVFVMGGALVASLATGVVLMYWNTRVLGEWLGRSLPAQIMGPVVLLVGIMLFEKFKKGFLKFANRWFFTTLYDQQKIMADFAAEMTRTIELEKIVEIITGTISRALGIEQYAFVLAEKKSPFNFFINKTSGIDPVQISKAINTIPFLGDYLEKTEEALVREEIERFVEEEELRPKKTTAKDREELLKVKKELDAFHIAVCLPMVSKKRLASLLFLGDKLTKDAFTVEDIHLLESIADQASIALENAKLYQETLNFAQKLQEEVKKATADLKIANEHLKELDTAKSEFMSIASHQLRTPLAGIIGYLSMLLEGDYGTMTPEEQKVMKEVFEAGQRLVRLVNTFLNVTRIEAGRLTLNPHHTNLVEEVAADIRQLKPPADAKGVQLVFKPAEKSLIAEVDADKLRDAFLNLIDNGIKYAPKGIVTVTLAREGTDHIRFSVHDTGVGIDPRETANLFQKFVRGTGIARIQPDGSGLGLFIVKKLVEAHRGKVWVESEGLGKGSTFHIVLPAKQPTVAS